MGWGESIGNFFGGIGRGLESIVSNPSFQQAAIGLGSSWIQSKISPPSPYGVPTVRQPVPSGYYPSTYYSAGVPVARAAPVPRAPLIAPSSAPNFLGLPGGRDPMQGFTGFNDYRQTGFSGAYPASPAGYAVPAVGGEGFGFGAELLERGQALLGGQPTMFRAGAPTARAVTMLEGRNPVTGKMHYWRHMGRPILFSGDLANCRRVGRVRTKLNRGRPRKR